MPFTDEEMLPISALQHLLFCERQCALIHIEGVWVDNQLTAEGNALHRRAHGGAETVVDGIRTARSLQLRSERLGIAGVSDAVEFHAGGAVVPVEYKRGRRKVGPMDRVQLCAQAMCLEEMLAVDVMEGALFYWRTRQRQRVPIDGELRALTEAAVTRLRRLVQEAMVPVAYREKKCERCSLIDVCLPRAPGAPSAREFLERELRASEGAS